MPDQREQKSVSSSNVSEQMARDLASEAYIFGFPLVLMDTTRQVTTATPKADEARFKAPINQFVHLRQFPDPTFTDVVSPNADTLYSAAWLDLAKEPVILSVPEMGSRYYLMPMLDAWTNVFASPGTRTTGRGKSDFAITGPNWTGKLPTGVQEIKAHTDMVWIIGRTQTNGKDDYTAVHAIQQQYKLTPLSAWGKPYTPPTNVPVEPNVDTTTPPVEQVRKMNSGTFFSRLKNLLKKNPPSAADAATMKRLAPLGDPKNVDPAVAKEVEAGVRDAQATIVTEAKKQHGTVVNGWEFMNNLGTYGTDYLWRSVVALIGLGANVPEDAVYPRATTDADGQPLTGANQYVMRFAPGQLPPVGAFWSVTLYNSKQFFVENPIDRYAIGDRDKLKFNDDGSLDLYIQNESPGKDKESNWLPAPKDNFNLFMRLYWPKQQVLEGAWKPPAVEREAAEVKRVA